MNGKAWTRVTSASRSRGAGVTGSSARGMAWPGNSHLSPAGWSWRDAVGSARCCEPGAGPCALTCTHTCNSHPSHSQTCHDAARTCMLTPALKRAYSRLCMHLRAQPHAHTRSRSFSHMLSPLHNHIRTAHTLAHAHSHTASHTVPGHGCRCPQQLG